MPKQQWIEANLKQGGNASRVNREMTVREFGEIQVVSYLSSIKGQSSSEFIVDVWKNDGGNSKLMARYIPGTH